MLELSDTVERKFIDSISLSDWEIETDSGWQDITHIHKTVVYNEWLIETESGSTLICADTHIVFDGHYNQVFVENLIPNQSKIITKNGPEMVIKCEKLVSSSNMFDVTVESDDHRFWTGDILSHNTTTTVGYMLWSVLFNIDYKIAILANKGSLAREILGRLQYAYEYVPIWLQQGIKVWNKGNIELENGSMIYAYATSASGIRGGTYNCVDGNSVTTVKINGNIFDISMKDLYDLIANSSKYICNNNDGVYEYVFREQIHKVVPTINTNGLFTDGLCEGETPQNTKKFRRLQQSRKSNILTDQTPYLGTQIVNQNDNWNEQEEDDLCFFYDDTYTNFRKTQHKTVSFGERTIEKLSVRPQIIGRNKKEDFQSKYGETEKYTKVGNTPKEYIQRSYWVDKIGTTCEQNKQESRKDTEDCGSSSGNEKNRRIKREDAKSKDWICSVEQRQTWNIFRRNFTENERFEIKSIEVLTEKGFKNFHGIKKTKNKKTIKVSTNDNTIICTPEHKIFTIDGYIEAQYCIDKHILNRNGKFELVNNLSENENIDVYDLLEVSDTHSYYCNNILVHQCIFLDEFAFVPYNMATDFFQSTYPVISSGKTTKVIIVSTPNGLNMFYKMWTDSIEKRSTYNAIEVHWSMVPGRDQAWKEETIRNTSEEQFRQEFECVDGDTIIEIYDKKTKEEYRVRIKDLYDLI